jgi:ribosomal protein S6--L-glutamate ligase
MILSFHPMFPADRNMICAGRPPGEEERLAIQAAAATILPQGCRRELYDMARRHCPLVFPDYTVRFDYPGKIGQIRLFRKTGIHFPLSATFSSVAQFADRCRRLPADLPFPYPFVVKFDWGGEGETVSLVKSAEQLDAILARAVSFERSGLSGFILQQFIACDNRVLRVVVVGSRIVSYWRVGMKNRPSAVSAAGGARIDFDADPDLRHRAVDAVKRFSKTTRINLAGFDLLYSSRRDEDEPYFLEINYFFGRRGLGGSETYYQLLRKEICSWLDRSGLTLNPCEKRK